MSCLQNHVTNSFYTKFYHSLQSFTGSATSTLIIGKLEFWFANPKYKEGFYKFVEPCAHPLYREGDSWSEELGISRKIFAKAFDLIGVRYKSKSAYLNAEDTFQGKLYASYRDRKTNCTYFIRNHDFVSQLLEGLFQRKTKPTSTKKKTKKSEANTSQKFPPPQEASDLPQDRSRNGQNGRSYACVSSYIQRKTSSLEHNDQELSPKQSSEENKLTEEMIKIWNEEIGELGVKTITENFAKRLYETFKIFFNYSLDAWKTYCQMISSSKFLMGEAQNKFFKKAWITWAIKPESIDRIKSGAFKLGDRQTNQDKEISEMDYQIKHVEIKKIKIENKMDTIREEIQEKRKELIKEKIKNLSERERNDFKKEFELLLETENNSLTEEFRRSRWKGMFISSYFDGFVREKIESVFFKTTGKEEEDKAIQASSLLEALEEASHELDLLKRKKRDGERKFQAHQAVALRPCDPQGFVA